MPSKVAHNPTRSLVQQVFALYVQDERIAKNFYDAGTIPIDLHSYISPFHIMKVNDKYIFSNF